MADGAEGLAWDYVIVGSGAGGGTLAARLAEAGASVFLIEAGGDPRACEDPRMPDDYDVPAFHAYACENEAMSWNFQVRHYASEERQARDPKYRAGDGVLYPRAAALGGCTAHNAMIFMTPHDSDWDDIAGLTGDASWRAPRMRRYARRLEDCRHAPFWRALAKLGIDPSGHGWDGWLRTEKSIPLDALGDDELVEFIRGTTRTFVRGLPTPLASTIRWLRRGADPNLRPWRLASFEGVCYTPLTTRGHARAGSRERVLDVASAHRDRIHVELDALATRIVLDDAGVARGVAYRKGKRLYRAHPRASGEPGEAREVRARREVIVCGGAFNTPQLLMLSGIGPATQLHRHGIAVRVDSPGVGENLQDRYEVALTHRVRRPWRVLEGATFKSGDPLWHRWSESRAGMYGSNGAALALIGRSSPAKPEPDLFCMALLARFEGYRPRFSELIGGPGEMLTWAILKAHTENRAGTVRLRSADPLDTPDVNFRYFDEGSDAAGEDLAGVVAGVRFVRSLTAPLIASGLIAEELMPGAAVASDAAIADYVRDTAWGHHASGTCAIGADGDAGAVLDSAFRVRGTRGLRVVDASVFPRIPGFFIASAVYMAAEKAADAILDDARATAPGRASTTPS
jgi:choline dehydrogenase-like flavoprotein